MPWWVLLAFIIAGTAAALYRTGMGGIHGVVWAEDGTIFLQGSYTLGAKAFATNYAGYLHSVPRSFAVVIAAVVPVEYHGMAVNLAAAMTQACVAAFAFCVVRSRSKSLVAPLLIALSVLMVPVGFETSANLSNLQWFLIFGAGISCLWNPNRAGRAASYAMTVAATLSSPFAALIAGMLGLAWITRRNVFRLRLACTAAAGTIVQGGAMVLGTSRGTVDLRLDPASILAAYLARILGDTFTGISEREIMERSDTLVPGLLVATVLLALGMVLAYFRAVSQMFAIMYLLSFSALIFVAPMALSGHDWATPGNADRYYLAPCLYLLCAVALLLDDLVQVVRRSHGTARPLWVAAGLVVLIALVISLSRSYDSPSADRQHPSWGSGIVNAQAACLRQPHLKVATVPVAPSGWEVLVPCDHL